MAGDSRLDRHSPLDRPVFRPAVRHRLLILTLVATLAAACGKSDEQVASEKAAEETREAAEALKKAAETTVNTDAAQGLQEFAKAMEGMAGAMSGTTPDGVKIEPIAFQELQTALPELSGWERDPPTGERMTSPVPFSQAEADYRADGAQVTVKVVDSAFSQLLIAPWAIFLTTGYEKQTADGYEKSVVVGGNPGFERWNSTDKEGELNLVFARRFLVTVEGENLRDSKSLYEFASKVDVAKLPTVK